MNLSAEEERLKEISHEMEVVEELIKRIVNENASKLIDQCDYKKRYDAQVERYEKLQESYNSIESSIERKKEQSHIISGFMFAIMELESLPVEFNDKLWITTVDTLIVFSDGKMVFLFRDGSEIEMPALKRRRIIQ